MTPLAEIVGMYVANAASKVVGRAMELMTSMGHAREGERRQRSTGRYKNYPKLYGWKHTCSDDCCGIVLECKSL